MIAQAQQQDAFGGSVRALTTSQIITGATVASCACQQRPLSASAFGFPLVHAPHPHPARR